MSRSLRILVLAGTAALPLGFASPARADATCVALAISPGAKAACGWKAGDLAEVRLADLRPTQPSLGFDELHYRLGRFQFGKDKINKRFDDWCEASGLKAAEAAPAGARLSDPSTFSCKLKVGAETKASIEAMKTAVVGPGGQLYLTDGHHTLTSFMEAPDGGPDTVVRVRITHAFGDLTDAAFWSRMKADGLTWLRDADGKDITPEQLPRSLGMKNFGNDRYRSVLYFGRDIGFEQVPENTTFQEFYWGAWLRDHPTIKLANYDLGDMAGYLALLKDVTRAQSALADDAIVAEGRTAKVLGRITWNGGEPETGGEFAKQSKPYADSKPGKLAYAFAYKKAHKD